MNKSDNFKSDFELLISNITNDILKNILYKDLVALNKEMNCLKDKSKKDLKLLNENINNFSNNQICLEKTIKNIESCSKNIKNVSDKLETTVEEIISVNKKNIIYSVKEEVEKTINKKFRWTNKGILISLIMNILFFIVITVNR